MKRILPFHLLTALICVPAGAVAESSISFRADVAPILQTHCLACHDAKSAEGGYQVDSFDMLLKPGDSGIDPIHPTKDVPSELLRRLTCDDESERMPAETDPLSDQEIALIKAWIDAGAKFDGADTDAPLADLIPAKRYPDPPESYAVALPITAICFSADGQRVLVGGYHEIHVWNIADGKLVRRITNIGQRTYSLDLTNDGKQIIAGCGEPGHSGEVRVIDVESGEMTAMIGRAKDVVLDTALHPDSVQLAIASADGLIQIIDLATKQQIKTIASHADAVNAVTWSDDGKLLASASDDKSIRVFDADSTDLKARYTGHGNSVRALTILADGKQVVSSGADKKLHRWNIADGKRVAAVATAGTGFQVARKQDILLVGGDDQNVSRFDLGNNQFSSQSTGHNDWVLSLAIDPTGTRFASGSFDGEVRVWNLADGSLESAWVAKP